MIPNATETTKGTKGHEMDGEKLVDLLERYQIGVIPVSTFEIDESFFSKFSNIQ